MASYPNKDALYKAHDIYRDAMRDFIPSTTPEELISTILDREPIDDIKASIDIGNIPHLLRTLWDEVYRELFDYKGAIDIRSTTSVIRDGRNKSWAHPGTEDVAAGFARTHLFLIADVLGEIGKQSEKNEVEAIRDQLFSDDRIAVYKKRLTTMSSRLTIAVAGKTTAEERLSDILNRLEEAEVEKTELEKHLKTVSDRLKDVERENAAYNKPLEPIPVSDNSPDSVTFQGTTFTKLLNEYHVAGDDISQSFWHYWQLQGREGKQEMRDAGWSIEKVDGDWEVMISPEDFQAWIMDEVTELKNLLDFLRNEEPSTQPIHPFYERTSLPTVREMEQPALRVLADGKEHRRVEIIDYLTEHFSLTDDERSYLSKTGQSEKHLVNEGLIERTRTGYYRITARGRRKVRTL